MFARVAFIFGLGFCLHAQVPVKPRKGDLVARMQAMLERYDSNKDGVLTKAEFRGRAEHWRRMDVNQDGSVTDADFAAIRSRKGRGQGGLSGADKSPAVGDPVGDFTLKILGSDETITLSERYADKPVVLTFGSYTCPPFRRALEGMEAVYQAHEEDCHFFLIYIKEAHPSDGWVKETNVEQKISILQHLSFDARSDAAKTCQGALNLSMPVLVDSIDNANEIRFAAWPNRCYVIAKGGVITYTGQRGPNGTVPSQVSAAIKKLP